VHLTIQVEFNGIVRGATTGTIQPACRFKEYTLSEWLQHEKNTVIHFKNLIRPGRALADLYRAVAKKEPGTKAQECNGRYCNVKAYTDQQIEGVAEGQTGFTLIARIVEEFKLL
jgi:hypothetical protein